MRGILLDRDGVINQERADYVKSWDEFVFLPGALTALKTLATLSVPIVIITNQSVIGREIVSRNEIDQIHQRLQQVVAAQGGRIDGFFLCPHHPKAGCSCRKPKPGLLQQAAAAFKFPLHDTIFVGDAITDYQAAQAAGCQSILVRSGRQGKELPNLLAAVTSTGITSTGIASAGIASAGIASEETVQWPPLLTDLAEATAFMMERF